MRSKILIAVLALSLPLSACETTNEPPSGEIIGGICRGATPTLDIATGLKPRLPANVIAIVSEGAGYINSFCSQATPPTLTASAAILIAIALTKLLPDPSAPHAVVPQSAVAAVVDWPTQVRDPWNAAYARWNAA